MVTAAGALSTALGRAVRPVDVPRALHSLVADTAVAAGAPGSLRELGLREADIPRAAGLAVARPYPNPRPVDGAAVRALLERAYRGVPPSTED
jgi:maleylacetate reductase